MYKSTGLLAESIQRWLDDTLIKAGVGLDWLVPLKTALLLLAVIIFSAILFYIARNLIVRLLHNFFLRTSSKWDDVLVEHRVFRNIAHLVPVLVFMATVDIVFAHYPEWLPLLHRLLNVYLILVLVKVLISFLRGMESFLSGIEAFKDKPLASYFQLARIIIYIATGILVLSILMARSPIYFLSAFGAMTAILLLIFRDTILGLVASVQISANDMVRVGDWIEMPKYNADGDVLAINLNTVKVSNWDKTITTIPTHYFISESFKNWRGMQLSGGRRIKRALYINLRSIKFVDPVMRERFKQFDLIRDYIVERQLEIEEYNRMHNVNTAALINGRRMTNIGVFRRYAEAYLQNHKGINQNMTLMVRHLAPTDHGLPLEIYCFNNTVRWLEYEPIHANIFDHLLSAAPFFDLEVFQTPSGTDITTAGAALAGFGQVKTSDLD